MPDFATTERLKVAQDKNHGAKPGYFAPPQLEVLSDSEGSEGGGGGGTLKIFVGGVRHDSKNPYPISDQNIYAIFQPYFRPGAHFSKVPKGFCTKKSSNLMIIELFNSMIFLV